jgi:cell division protein FtsX
MPKLDGSKKRVIHKQKLISAGVRYMSKLSDKEKENLPEITFAFPKERKEPLDDARHVQDAIARFDQVKNVTNEDRDEAWKRIQKAAKKFGVQ